LVSPLLSRQDLERDGGVEDGFERLAVAAGLSMQVVERLPPARQRSEDPELEQGEQDRGVEKSLCDLERRGLPSQRLERYGLHPADASALGSAKSSHAGVYAVDG